MTSFFSAGRAIWRCSQRFSFNGRPFSLSKKPFPFNKKGLLLSKKGLLFNGRPFPLSKKPFPFNKKGLPPNKKGLSFNGKPPSLSKKALRLNKKSWLVGQEELHPPVHRAAVHVGVAGGGRGFASAGGAAEVEELAARDSELQGETVEGRGAPAGEDLVVAGGTGLVGVADEAQAQGGVGADQGQDRVAQKRFVLRFGRAAVGSEVEEAVEDS